MMKEQKDGFLTGAKAMTRDSNAKWSDVAACDHTVNKSMYITLRQTGAVGDFWRVAAAI